MRRTIRATVAGVVAAGIVLASAVSASAHNYVVSSTPAEDEVLTELPARWEIVTNDALLYVGNTERFGLWVRDADGVFYGDGCVDVSGPGMTASAAIGAPGDYTLVYSLVSADGHPLTGEIPFEWAPTGDHEPAAGTDEAVFCGAEPAVGGEPSESRQPAGVPGDVWWIVAAVLAVAVAVTVAIAVGRRGRSTPETDA